MNKQEFSKRLKEQLMSSKLTLESVAKMAEVSEATVRRWVNKNTGPVSESKRREIIIKCSVVDHAIQSGLSKCIEEYLKENLIIETSLDYYDCYYPGDSPTINLVISLDGKVIINNTEYVY